MSKTSDLTEVERQLLMAAAVQQLGPTTNLTMANTARIVDQVLRWRGLSDEQIVAGWRGEDCAPEHKGVYAALVRMTHQKCRDGSFRPHEHPGPALFEGGGNWGVPGDPDQPPCWPHFNSCRLTDAGEQLARALLKIHPAYCNSADPAAAAVGGGR